MSARLLVPAALFLCALVTHPATAGNRPKLVTTTYQVADLVLLPNDAGQAKTTEETLIKLVTNTIQPRSWSDQGGPGTIDYFPMTMALVVNQTTDVQDQIADLLAALRRLQDQEVAVEVRFITVHRCEAKLDSAVTFLNDRQLGKLFQTIQGDASNSVMQAPKLTIRNGQTAVLDLTEKKSYVTDVVAQDNHGEQVAYCPKTEKVTTGMRLSVRPAVSADRRSVQVALEVHQSEVDAPVPLFPIVMPIKPVGEGEPVVFTQYIQQPKLTTHTMQRTLTIPDGHTAVMGGWTQRREERHEAGLPILSDLPYLGRLFKTVGYSTGMDQVLVLVTPRIVAAQEKEERKAGCSCSPATSAACALPAALPAVVQCGLKEKPCAGQKVAELLSKYHTACRVGRLADATQLAVQALALDPTCFSKGCGCVEQP